MALKAHLVFYLCISGLSSMLLLFCVMLAHGVGSLGPFKGLAVTANRRALGAR